MDNCGGIGGKGGNAGALGCPVDPQSPLASARAFAVLAASTVTNADATVIGGEVGVSPGNAASGLPPGTVIHAGDPVAAQAQIDVSAAANGFSAAPCTTILSGMDLGGLTLKPGVYCFAAGAVVGSALVLDAQGDPDASFVFQIGSTLVTAVGSSVVVIHGGNACNVFWIVGSSATLSGGTNLSGNVLAAVSVTLEKLTTVSGRVFARTGAVTMDANMVSTGACGM